MSQSNHHWEDTSKITHAQNPSYLHACLNILKLQPILTQRYQAVKLAKLLCLLFGNDFADRREEFLQDILKVRWRQRIYLDVK